MNLFLANHVYQWQMFELLLESTNFTLQEVALAIWLHLAALNANDCTQLHLHAFKNFFASR